MSKGVVGFPNLGNTCYFNSITQCLTHSIPLAKYFAYDKYLEDSKKDKILDIFSILNKLIWFDPSDKAKISKCLEMLFGTFGMEKRSFFRRGLQQDAFEAYMHMMDIIHEKIKYSIMIVISNEPKTRLQHLQYDAIKSWESFFKKDYSKMVDVFYGQLHTTLIRLPKREVSYIFEPFNALNLPIPNSIKDCNIYDCLNTYTEQENIDSKLLSKKMFWKLPKNLVICFNRFNNGLRKVNRPVDFPINDLEMKNYVSNKDNQETKYDLFGVCHHFGNTGGGHYTASCRTNGTWYYFNDSVVNELKEVDKNTAYILFYRCKDIID